MSQITSMDQTGNKISLSFPPARIISLVPSQTELLADLGLDNRVVGITKFCSHPKGWRKQKTIIGGTKNFHFEAIDDLRPDLILGNKEENYKEGIETLRSRYPVWVSDISTFDDALNMIADVGRLTDTQLKATEIIHRVQKSFEQIQKLPNATVLYLIWRNPWMGAASGTFISEMLNQAGLKNCLQNMQRYPTLSDDDLVRLNPEIVFLSSEPYPFKEKHVNELTALLPQAKVLLVDGEMFSWYGSRMLHFAEYVSKLKNQLV